MEVGSETVDLSEYVGHKVTVSGYVLFRTDAHANDVVKIFPLTV
jgi:hypothetical protein